MFKFFQGFFLTIFLGCCWLEASSWNASTIISTSTTANSRPHFSMSTDGLKVITVWVGSSAGTVNIYASFSTDKGVSWSVPVIVSALSAFTDQLNIAASSDASKAVVVWGDSTNIYTSSTANTGATWSAPKLQSTNADFFSQLAIRSDGNNVIVVWREKGVGVSNHVAAVSSSDGGSSWTLMSNISPSAVIVDNIQVSMSSDPSSSKGIVTWVQDPSLGIDNIKASYTLDNGATWSPEISISTAACDKGYLQLKMSSDGSKALAVWVEYNGPTDILTASRSTDTGATWTSPISINPASPSSDNEFIDLAMSSNGSTAIVVWQGHTSFFNIYASASIDSGATWSSQTLLSTTSTGDDNYQSHVAISSDGSTAIALWESVNSMYSSLSKNSGSTWSTPVSVPPSPLVNASSSSIGMSSDGSISISVWDYSSNIYGSYFPAPILPPATASGAKNYERFASQSFFYNYLMWTASPTDDVTSYNIYRDLAFIVNVPASFLEYKDQPVKKRQAYEYTIKSVSSDGIEGEGISFVVQ